MPLTSHKRYNADQLHLARLKKQLLIVAIVALLAGVTAAVLSTWDQLTGTPADRVIRVYRVHGCRCVFAWTRSLEAAGFVVRMQEQETLGGVRARLREPSRPRGCHVAEYLGYFLEGHVSPQAVRQLAVQRPDGRGLTTEVVVVVQNEHSYTVSDERSPVLLIDKTGSSRPWSVPSKTH